MDTVYFNMVDFLIEFLKLYMAVGILLKIEIRKTIWISFITALFALTCVSVIFDCSEMSFVYAIVVIGIFSINAQKKKNAGLIVLLYIGISIIDMIYASICITVFHLNEDMIAADRWLNIGLNLFSLILLLLLYFILGKKRERHQTVSIKKYVILYLLGGISLSLYLTAIQFMEMGENHSIYGTPLAVGMNLSSLILVVVCVLLIINNNRNEHLKREAEITAELLEAQKVYYTMLLEKEKETRAFRHDMKQHLYCMYNLYKNEKYVDLGEYLYNLNDCVEEFTSEIQTGNSFITVIANDICRKYPDVKLQWLGTIPDGLSIALVDICTIFYNILSNAFEAAHGNHPAEVKVYIKFMKSTLMISIINPCDKEPEQKNGDFVSTKLEGEHGYGIKNAKKTIEKNGGAYFASWDTGFFTTEVILPNVL